MRDFCKSMIIINIDRMASFDFPGFSGEIGLESYASYTEIVPGAPQTSEVNPKQLNKLRLAAKIAAFPPETLKSVSMTVV